MGRGQSDIRWPGSPAAGLGDGRLNWGQAVGAADVKEKRDTTPDTQYRLGSITKTFTAAAIMQLRDEGKLDLEDTLDKHIDGVAHTPTLRRLLSHTSGMQRDRHDDTSLHASFDAVPVLHATPAPTTQILHATPPRHHHNHHFPLTTHL